MEALIDITLPHDQLEGTEAKISHWLIEIGQTVSEGDPIVELETDKVSMEICAPANGVLSSIDKQPGDEVEPESVLGQLNGAKSEQVKTTPLAPEQSTKPPQLEPSSTQKEKGIPTPLKQLVGPAVRKLLRENSLDINLISGSGRHGRVTRDDVLKYLNNPQDLSQSTSTLSAPTPQRRQPIPTTPSTMTSREIAHTPMRKAIAKHMADSLLHTSPHVTSVFEMDMSNIIEHRRWHKKEFSNEGVKLTFTAYFLAATTRAMQSVPQMNARYHEHALEIFDDINIGIGTALGDDGLVVPVVQKVQEMSLFDIAQALQGKTDKARAGKLTPADMKHGTFTISNHGVSGSLLATPIIINQPQVAILGIGKLDKRVVVRTINEKETMTIKPMCYVSLSIDHRAVDAFQTNQFLSVFVDTIETWGD